MNLRERERERERDRDEHLELLQDLLERSWPPIKRKPQTAPTTPSGGRSTQAEHVIKFMRRQADFDALRVAAGVVFTVAGVIKESPEFRDESLLLGEFAGEIQNIGRRLCGEERRDQEALAEPRPLTADEAAQWQLHLQEEEEQAQQAAATLEDKTPSERSKSSSTNPTTSQRRRRLLAHHHKEHIGGDKSRGEDDDHSLMATSSSHTDMGDRKILSARFLPELPRSTLPEPRAAGEKTGGDVGGYALVHGLAAHA